MQLHKNLSLLISTSISLLLVSSPLVSQANEPQANETTDKGYIIAKERKVRDKGWQASEQSILMVLRNAQGNESIREIRTKSLEVENDGDKGLTIFDKPRDVKGTAFLSFSHTAKADDQWLYLPALKRVKRISSRNKSGPFMGSEFAYEDLSSFELEKYNFTFIKNETCPTNKMLTCFVIDSIPTDKFSGYTKQTTWIDQTEYLVQKVDFYDRKKSLLKTLTATDYHQYQNKFWRAHTLTMNNHQTNKQTILKTSNITFDVELSESDFNQNSLKRAR